MQTQLEGAIAELVSTIVRQTEQRVERAFGEAIERELLARRNGQALDVESIAHALGEQPVDEKLDEHEQLDVPDPPQQASTKVCRACHETKPVAAFTPDKRAPGGRRSVCRSCKQARDRETRAQRREPREPADEPHPAPRSTMRRGGRILGADERAEAEKRRELLAELRANGVERETIDGREFVVLTLPSTIEHEHRRAAPPPVRLRHARGVAIA